MNTPDDSLSAPDFPVGARVLVTSGMWAGLAGAVDPLTTTVTGPAVRIVRVDEPEVTPKGTKKGQKTVTQRFAPLSRLIVVAVRDLALEVAAESGVKFSCRET